MRWRIRLGSLQRSTNPLARLIKWEGKGGKGREEETAEQENEE